MKRYPLLLLPLYCSTLFAEVPYVFESGTPARASEVNENFKGLDSDIEANTARILSLESNEGATGELDGCDVSSSFTTSFPSISFEQKTSSVGDLLTIGGQDYRVILVGIKEFGSGDSYSIKYPALVSESSEIQSSLSAHYITGETKCQNDTISGFPARTFVSASQFYNIRNGGVQSSSGELRISQQTEIVVGQTSVSLFRSIAGASSSSLVLTNDFDFTDDLVGDISEVDTLVQAMDDFIDYIEITRVN